MDIEKQIQERQKAFNEDNVQSNSEALEAMIVRQRETIMKLLDEKEKTR